MISIFTLVTLYALICLTEAFSALYVHVLFSSSSPVELFSQLPISAGFFNNTY